MRVDLDQLRYDVEAGDPGFLSRLASGDVGDGLVRVLAVPTELDPLADPGMQREQHVGAGRVDHDGRRGDVPRRTLAKAPARCGRQEREHGVT